MQAVIVVVKVDVVAAFPAIVNSPVRSAKVLNVGMTEF